MSKGAVNISLKAYKKLEGKLKKIDKESEKVIQRTTSDFKSRAPGWVSAAITSVYNIKKADINGSKKDARKAGKIKVEGRLVDNIQLIYEGRLLTPVHFNMTPKVPPQGRSYTLKMKVFKGKSTVIGRYNKNKKAGGPYSQRSHNILMPTGAKGADKVSHIPFQRMSKRRGDIKKFTTTSVPEMITNKDVSEKIYSNINENLQKRLEHHLEGAMKKL